MVCPFTCYRGAGPADLASTPVSWLAVQACGDVHQRLMPNP
jgi:hypothetical protein